MPTPTPPPPPVRITDCPWDDCPAAYTDTRPGWALLRLEAISDEEAKRLGVPLSPGELLGRAPIEMLDQAAHRRWGSGAE